MVLITIVTGAYKPIYNWGASHCSLLNSPCNFTMQFHHGIKKKLALHGKEQIRCPKDVTPTSCQFLRDGGFLKLRCQHVPSIIHIIFSDCLTYSKPGTSQLLGYHPLPALLGNSPLPLISGSVPRMLPRGRSLAFQAVESISPPRSRSLGSTKKGWRWRRAKGRKGPALDADDQKY